MNTVREENENQQIMKLPSGVEKILDSEVHGKYK